MGSSLVTGTFIVLGAFFVVLILLSQRLGRHIKTVDGFFLADRKLGSVSVVLTFVASWFGAASTIATLNAVHARGLNGLWDLVIPSVLSCVCITIFLAKKVAMARTFSQPEAIEKAYGDRARVFLSIVILLASINFVASQLVAAGQLFQSLLAVPLFFTVPAIAAGVMTYTWLGGYLAVVMTDKIQVGAITIGLLMLLGFSVMSLLNLNRPLGGEHVSFVTFEWHELLPTNSKQWGMVLTFVLGWIIAPEMWQRMSSMGQPKDAQKAAGLATLLIFALLFMVVTIGLLSQHLLSQSGNVLADMTQLMPPILGWFVLLGVMAAISSTMDSSLNVGSMTLTVDVFARFVWPNATQVQLVRLSRLSTGLMLIPAVAIALYFQDIIRILWISADIYAACMLIPVLMMLYWRHDKLPRKAGQFAILGGLFVVTFTFAQQVGWLAVPSFWPAWPWTTLLGVGVSLLGFMLGWILERLNPEHATG